MGTLQYLITTSLDGYVADANGNFDWAEPSEEVHAFINEICRNVGVFLFGRRVYETMAVWDTISSDGSSTGTNEFKRIWDAAQKIVYSKTLDHASTAYTVIEKSFEAEVVHRLVNEATVDYGIGGPHLAAEAMRAGIIDDYHQFIVPKIVGAGIHWLPDDLAADLRLVDTRKFSNGTVYLHYQPVRQT